MRVYESDSSEERQACQILDNFFSEQRGEEESARREKGVAVVVLESRKR
jgi:hypothetical protein